MIMLVQNGIFTAEAPLPASRQGGPRESILLWREMPPNKKVSVLSRQASSLGAIASKRFRSSSRRPACRQGVFDPIAVSRLRGRSRCGAAKARLDQKKTPLSDLCGSAVSLIAFKPPQ